MPESPLTISYLDLLAETGFMMGYGRDREAWSADQAAEVDFLVQSGVRQFYWPAVGPGGAPHSWRFFRPSTSLVTVADQSDYDAPDDFGGLVGSMTFSAEEGNTPIRVIPEGRIQEFRQSSQSGRPVYVAVRPKAFDPETGQRFEFIFAPGVDAVYNLWYTYNVVAGVKPSVDEPYIYGGAAHSETVLASCRAVAEQRIYKQRGTHWDDFNRLLAASIAADLRSTEPAYLGYNGDASDGEENARLARNGTVNYVGPAYGP